MITHRASPAPTQRKLATLTGVREYVEGAPVELWLLPTGRVVVRAYNECGNNFTEVDLGDLFTWSRHGGIAAVSAAE